MLREATRQAGVVPSAAYRHFEDRRALLDAVCSAAQAALAVAIEEELAGLADYGNPADAARARLRAVGTGYMRFARKRAGALSDGFLGVGQFAERRQPGACREWRHDALPAFGRRVRRTCRGWGIAEGASPWSRIFWRGRRCMVWECSS